MDLHPTAWYARQLKPALPEGAFAPARSRLAWLPIHLSLIVAGAVAIATSAVSWPIALLISLAIGVCFAGVTFLGHETLHGAVVRGRKLRHVIGFITFLPFVLSPRLWVRWHNKVHHNHTNEPGVDPDAYPTLADYRESKAVRVVTDHFALGRRRWAGVFGLVFGFTGQCAQMLVRGRALGLSKAEHRRAIAETALGIGFWALIAALVGFVPFLLVFVLPHLVANAIVMSFIYTNHNLNPQMVVNDPLVGSLSVTTPRFVDFITLRFGFHVEHHVFPTMSSRHAPAVRALLRARFPDRYQAMPLGRALLTLVRTARIYKTPTELVDPRTGREFPVLLPRTAPEGALLG